MGVRKTARLGIAALLLLASVGVSAQSCPVLPDNPVIEEDPRGEAWGWTYRVKPSIGPADVPTHTSCATVTEQACFEVYPEDQDGIADAIDALPLEGGGIVIVHPGIHVTTRAHNHRRNTDLIHLQGVPDVCGQRPIIRSALRTDRTLVSNRTGFEIGTTMKAAVFEGLEIQNFAAKCISTGADLVYTKATPQTIHIKDSFIHHCYSGAFGMNRGPFTDRLGVTYIDKSEMAYVMSGNHQLYQAGGLAFMARDSYFHTAGYHALKVVAHYVSVENSVISQTGPDGLPRSMVGLRVREEQIGNGSAGSFVACQTGIFKGNTIYAIQATAGVTRQPRTSIFGCDHKAALFPTPSGWEGQDPKFFPPTTDFWQPSFWTNPTLLPIYWMDNHFVFLGTTSQRQAVTNSSTFPIVDHVPVEAPPEWAERSRDVFVNNTFDGYIYPHQMHKYSSRKEGIYELYNDIVFTDAGGNDGTGPVPVPEWIVTDPAKIHYTLVMPSPQSLSGAMPPPTTPPPVLPPPGDPVEPTDPVVPEAPDGLEDILTELVDRLSTLGFAIADAAAELQDAVEVLIGVPSDNAILEPVIVVPVEDGVIVIDDEVSECPFPNLPSKPGLHVTQIKAMEADSWLNLGSPAADPVWGKARGRSFGARAFALAPEYGGAFLKGEGPHSFIKPDDHAMDDLWFYDINAHRWVNLYEGNNIGTFNDRVFSGVLSIDDNGQLKDGNGDPLPLHVLIHSWDFVTYNPDIKKLAFIGFDSERRDDGMGRYLLPGLETGTGDVARIEEGITELEAQRATKTIAPMSPWFYSPETCKFERHVIPAIRPSVGTKNSAFIYVPSQGRYLNLGNNGVASFDGTAWSMVADSGPRPPSGDYGIAHDTARDQLYLGPGYNGTGISKYDVATQTWTTLPEDVNAPTTFHSHKGSILYDSVSDVISVFHYDEKMHYTYDIASGVWSKKALPNIFSHLGKKTASRVNAFYSPAHNAHFFHVASNGQDDGVIWVYRFGGGA